jgi:hypothetical protein
MSTHRWPRHHRARALGITLLILSLVHAPWPQADFHNVRHQDAPGQVCEHHDHLLRWHPDAGQAEDVAILHWHWFLPSSGPVEPGHSGQGPALHAHVDGWDATTPDSGPVVVPDGSSRPLDSPPPSPLLAGEAAPFVLPGDDSGPRLKPGPVHVFAPRTPLACWLQRWSC